MTRALFISVLFLFSLHCFPSSFAQLVNVTVDDTDPHIIYQPSTSWHASTVPCTLCLNPPNASLYMQTWHDGTHIIPTKDQDDETPDADDTSQNNAPNSIIAVTQSQTQAPSPTPASTSSSAAPATSSDGDHGHHGRGGSGGTGSGAKLSLNARRSSRIMKHGDKRDNNPFETQNLDSDDPGFVDPPVYAQFDFIGTAVYIYAVLPMFEAAANTTPTAVNLTFHLDQQPVGTFHFQGTNPSTQQAWKFDQLVFNSSNLPDANHSLVVNVGPDSVFLLDYAIYSTSQKDANDASSSADMSPATEKHNVTTFIGAIGGSVGFLGLISLGVCVSLNRRRWQSKRREMRERQAASYAQQFTAFDHGGIDEDHAGGINVAPMMTQAGPAPFVPRYFPGTLPSCPPPYQSSQMQQQPSHSTSSNSLSESETPPPPLTPDGTTPSVTLERVDTEESYANRPPPTPPEGIVIHEAPFTVPIISTVRMSPVLSTILSASTPTTSLNLSSIVDLSIDGSIRDSGGSYRLSDSDVTSAASYPIPPPGLSGDNSHCPSPKPLVGIQPSPTLPSMITPVGLEPLITSQLREESSIGSNNADGEPEIRR